MKREPVTKQFSLNDTLLIAFVTLGGYAVVAMFQSGTLRYYGLPAELNRPDITSAFNVLGNMFSVAFSAQFDPTKPGEWGRAITDWLMAVPLIALVWPGCFVIGVRDEILQKFPRVVAAPCLVSFLFTPIIMAPYHLILYIVVGVYIAIVATPHIKHPPHHMWRPDPTDRFWQNNLSERIEVTTYRIALVAFAIMPVAYYLGYEAPSRARDVNIASLTDATGHTMLFAVLSMNPDTAYGLRLIRNDPAIEYTESVGLLKLPRGTVINIGNCKFAEGRPRFALERTYPTDPPLLGHQIRLKSDIDCPVRDPGAAQRHDRKQSIHHDSR